MPDYNFTLIETTDDIAFIHTLIYEAVEGLGGDDMIMTIAWIF